MAVTMKQIAEMAGVSIGTVDRALNKRGRIAPDVAERICKIAETLNYRPNSVAKSLAIRNQNLSIGVIIHVEKNAYYSDVVAGVETAAEEIKDFGISVVVRYGINFDYQVQLHLIDELLAEGINALAIVPINHPEISAKLNALHQTGFPIVFITASLRNTGHLAYVGCDHQKTGAIAARLLNLISGGQGNVLAISPSYRMLEHRLRMEYFRDYLGTNFPGLHLLEVTELSNDRFHNYQLTKDSLERNAQANYLFCGSSSSVLQAVDEFTMETNSHLKVIGFDFSDATKEAMKKDLILATITQNPRGQGYRATMILFNLLTGHGIPDQKDFYMDHQILVKESLSD